MRRTGSGALVALSLVLLLLWYMSTSREHHAESVASLAGKKVMVMASTGSEDLTWIEDNSMDWYPVIYDMSGSSHATPGMHRVPKVKGREAMAYLTYIIDHYDKLADFTAFVHANRSEWRDSDTGNDNVDLLKSLRLKFVDHHGYASLRCSWAPGCPDGVQPYSRRYGSAASWEGQMPLAWQDLFGDHVKFPRILGAPGHNQFVVPRWQVRKRFKHEYLHYRDWLLGTLSNDRDSSTIFEYLWHIIFQRPPIYCPDEYSCACDQFGRC